MLGFDTETHWTARGRKIGKLVCLSVCGTPEDTQWLLDRGYGAADQYTSLYEGTGDRLFVLSADAAVDATPELLSRALIGHNTSYDLAVLCEAHRRSTDTDLAIRTAITGLWEGRYLDTMIGEKLLRLSVDELEFCMGPGGKIERTGLSLADLVLRYFGVDISESKTDPLAWRKRYHELEGVPLSEWPQAALDYSALDSVWPMLVRDAQLSTFAPTIGGFPIVDRGYIVSEEREVFAQFALDLQAAWGVRADPAAVTELVAEWTAEAEKGRQIGRDHGWVRVKGRDAGKPGSVQTKVLQARIDAAYKALGLPTPRTAPSGKFPEGQIKKDEETLKESGDPVLLAYAESLETTLWLTRYAEPARLAASLPLTVGRANACLETGRTSLSDPAFQQPPRKGGYRRVHIPRLGWAYVAADYDFIELCSLAQICIWSVGYSILGDRINQGLDPHLSTAAMFMRAVGADNAPASYEDAVSRYRADDADVVAARQIAKPINFGLPGRMGAKGLAKYAWNSYHVRMDVDTAAVARDAWLEEYHEVPEWFNWNDLNFPDGTVRQWVSGRVRSGCTYTSTANTQFQGLAADGAKYAYMTLASAAYTGIAPPDAPIEIVTACQDFHGCRPVLFLHDEQISEVPLEVVHEAAHAQSAIMRWAMEQHIPDVKIGCKPVAMDRWIKGAKPTYVDGRLTVTKGE